MHKDKKLDKTFLDKNDVKPKNLRAHNVSLHSVIRNLKCIKIIFFLEEIKTLS